MMTLTCVLLLVMLVAPSVGRVCICGATRSGDDVNIRSCAGISCSVVASLAAGSCADYQNQQQGPWLSIKYKGASGWIHADYVSGPQECGGYGSYCCKVMCYGRSSNKLRVSDAYGKGNFGASRGNRTHLGTDVMCTTGQEAYAPFNGVVVREAKPYGSGSCCDHGYLLKGTDIWKDYEVRVFYTEPDASLIGKKVHGGDRIGVHVGVRCDGCYGPGMIEHAHYQMYKKYNDIGVAEIIDGTSFVLCV